MQIKRPKDFNMLSYALDLAIMDLNNQLVGLDDAYENDVTDEEDAEIKESKAELEAEIRQATNLKARVDRRLATK